MVNSMEIPIANDVRMLRVDFELPRLKLRFSDGSVFVTGKDRILGNFYAYEIKSDSVRENLNNLLTCISESISNS